jgi:hypothetical protein
MRLIGCSSMVLLLLWLMKLSKADDNLPEGWGRLLYYDAANNIEVVVEPGTGTVVTVGPRHGR